MKLTDAELTRLAATAVMDWRFDQTNASIEDNGGLYGWVLTGSDWVYKERWQPLTDWRAAGEIVERMRAEGWNCLSMAVSTGQNMCDFYHGPEDEVGKSRRQSESMPRAITIAALLAVKAITGDQA